MLSVLDKWGCCQSAQFGPISKFFNNFLYKIQIEWGWGWSVLWKSMLICVFGALQFGFFQTIGGCLPKGPIWTNFKFFQQFHVQNQDSKRLNFMEKLISHVFRALWGRPSWLNTCLPTGQKWAVQIVFDHFGFKFQNNFGSVLCKKLIRSKIGILDFGQSANGHLLIF